GAAVGIDMPGTRAPGQWAIDGGFRTDGHGARQRHAVRKSLDTLTNTADRIERIGPNVVSVDRRNGGDREVDVCFVGRERKGHFPALPGGTIALLHAGAGTANGDQGCVDAISLAGIDVAIEIDGDSMRLPRDAADWRELDDVRAILLGSILFRYLIPA